MKYYIKKYINQFIEVTGIGDFLVILFEGPGSVFIWFSIINIVCLNFFLETDFDTKYDNIIHVMYSLGLFLTYCIIYAQVFNFFKSRISFVKSDMENLKSQMEEIQSLSDPIYNNDKFYNYPKYLQNLVEKIDRFKPKKDSYYNQYDEVRRISELQMKFTERALTVLFIMDAFVIVYYGNSVILTIFAVLLNQLLARGESV